MKASGEIPCVFTNPLGKINDKLMPLHHALFVESSPAPVKYAASKLGLCKDDIRLPLTSISDETKQLVDKAMKHASLI